MIIAELDPREHLLTHPFMIHGSFTTHRKHTKAYRARHPWIAGEAFREKTLCEFPTSTGTVSCLVQVEVKVCLRRSQTKFIEISATSSWSGLVQDQPRMNGKNL